MLALSLSLAPSGVKREEANDKRAALNALEGTVLDEATWSTLSQWTKGGSLSGMKDSVTILAALDAEDRKTIAALRQLASLQERFGTDKVKVVGVFGPDGYDDIVARDKEGKLPIATAVDTDGALAKLLAFDNAPDFYVFDTAGQLRYADVTNAGMVRAVSRLIKETPEQAIENAKDEAKERPDDSADPDETTDAGTTDETGATDDAANDSDATGTTDDSTTDDAAPADDTPDNAAPASKKAPAADYRKAKWPAHNTVSGFVNRQGERINASLKHTTWLTEEPKSLENTVVVLDFWATWCGPCIAAMPILEELADRHESKLAIIAVGGQSEPIEKVREFVEAKDDHAYHYVYDAERTLIGNFRPEGIPHVVVISSDGVVRWQGNPHEPAFKAAVDTAVEVDPGVKLAAEARSSGSSDADGMTDADPSESQPSPGGYGRSGRRPAEALPWPAHNTENLYAGQNLQGKPLGSNPFDGLTWLSDSGAPDTDGKVLILDFWATWCGPCKKFSTVLDAVVDDQELSGEVVAVAISGQKEDEQTVRSFLASSRHSFEYAHAADQDLYKRLGVRGIPHVLVLSSDGVVRWQGFPSADVNFKAIVEQVVDADKKRRNQDAGGTPAPRGGRGG
jgi:thiol-disulfide isomerase/thioredoxin